MKFYSTKDKNHLVGLREAVVHSLAPNGGLYMPEKIPTLSSEFFEHAPSLSFEEIALEVAKPFVENVIEDELLKRIVSQTITFDAPLVKVEENVLSLELFHGPTLAFKDFGARFMAHLLQHFAKEQRREVTVLVATSGDTGSAVANGFYNVPNVRVIILYPSGKVSTLQEKQFTTLGKNITAIEIDGTFDDCQHLVKTAFQDVSLNEQFFLTSANSINIARLLPQMFYYFYGWSRLARKNRIVFSVPSGNFGNLTAGLMAQRMGLPIHHFIASTNRNDSVANYLNKGTFTPHTSMATISNAMDVGNPSNFSRMLDLFENDWNSMRESISGFSFSDEETAKAMDHVVKHSHYVLDPHGAVGYLGLTTFLKKNPGYTGVFLETAHPSKFLEKVEPIIHKSVDIPKSLQLFLSREKKSIFCQADYGSFKNIVSNC
jgi:threonine synthase